jgi:CheY-like chemotaxis protein
VSVTAEQNNGLYVITVEDSGIGIEHAQLDTIFEPFAQVKSYETRNHEGTGLGLSIARRLVELHGGRIDVKSHVGSGSAFQVIVPKFPPITRGVPAGIGSPGRQQVETRPHFVTSKITKSETKKDNSEVSNNYVCGKHHPASPKTSPSSRKEITSMTQRSITRELLEDASIDDEPLRILAVDDTPVNLKILKNFLEKAGMTVTTAVNGIQLLELVSEDAWTNFDVVLLDWMMPEMDGVTACRLLRQRIPTDLLPVLFLTAKTDSGALETGFEVGGTDFITKPLNRKEVIARTLCQGHASRHARARFFDSIPIAPLILSYGPFWKMCPTSGSKEMFVIDIYTKNTSGSVGSVGAASTGMLDDGGDVHVSGSSSTSSIGRWNSHVLDGPLLLHYYQQEVPHTNWKFHELSKESVTFLSPSITAEQVKQFVRLCLAAWARDMTNTDATASSTYMKESSITTTTDENSTPLSPSSFPSSSSLSTTTTPTTTTSTNKPRVTVGIDYRAIHAHLYGEKLPMLAVVESCSEGAKSLSRRGTKHEEIVFSKSAQELLMA